MSTDKIENQNNAEAKIAKDELSEKELEKATGGSSSAGGGTGKVTFNEFTIKKNTDVASPAT